MTRREIVKAALNHQDTGRVPISLGSMLCDTLTYPAKDNLERYLGYEVTEHVMLEKQSGTVVLPEKIMELADNDFRPVRIGGFPGYEFIENEDGTYVDEWGCLLKPFGFFYDPIVQPLAGDITVSDIENHPWPEVAAPSRITGMKEEAIAIQERDFAVCLDIPGPGPFEFSFWIRGCEAMLVDLYLQPKIAEAFFNKVTEMNLLTYDLVLSEIGDDIDVVCITDDLGMQNGTFFPVEIYDKHLKKYHKRLNDFIKTKTDAKIMIHCCGSIAPMIPGLIEAGVDIINSVQTSARNMEPEMLKREYGRDMAFWGGLDVQHILPYGTPEEIENEVKRLMEVLGKDGGYVFAPAHNILPDVPPENIDCMMKSAIKYRNLK